MNRLTRKKLLLTPAFLLFVHLCVEGQGHLMVAGGNGEQAGGWSDLPYAWVVEKARNRRIAVISYRGGQSDWIPDYFKSLGAVHARNFYIPDRIVADQQSTYDSLLTYDGIFLKGGNQFSYYDRYKNTRTLQALQEIFNRGGVLSGTSAGLAILSPIVFTAEIASVDPSQALLNAYSPQVTLEDDFLQTLDARFIFDSHFVERGRLGRMPAFMATWFRECEERATGIGVDDRTAFCIDSSGMGYVYGTGAVNILYNLETDLLFDTTLSMPRAGNLELRQLLHGCFIHLASGKVEGYTSRSDPSLKEENGWHHIFACGTDYPSPFAYRHFVQECGRPSDVIDIITGMDLDRASDARSKLLDAGAGEVRIIQALSGQRYDPNVKEQLESAGKFLIIGNSYADFFSFLNRGGNGTVLKELLEKPGSISFFVGDNARFAGHTVVEKYRGAGYSSYEGKLEFWPGTGLLRTTCIMPYAFSDAEYYENTVSGLPYAMVLEALYHGIYLSGNTFMEYNFNEKGESWFRSLQGSFPLILLKHEGGPAGLASQGPGIPSRNVAGFASMKMALMAPSDSVIAGRNLEVALPQTREHPDPEVYPNPASGFLHIRGVKGPCLLRIIDPQGRIRMEERMEQDAQTDIRRLRSGIHILLLEELETGRRHRQKLIILNNLN